MAGLLDFIQGASNAAAGTVAGPVDLINMGLLGVGLPMPRNPVGGSQWMREKGLMREPENRVAGLLGEAAGNVLPIVAAAKAPQIAQGLLSHADQYRRYHAATTAPGAPATVWHGSPHRFDKFDSSKIGTGEGAQAYGHGLYFADNIDVAKNYIPRDEKYEAALMRLYKQAEARQNYPSMEVLEQAMLHSTPNELRKQFGKSAEPIIKQISSIPYTSGSLYKVDLPDDAIAKMLNYDAPLAKQPANVRDLVKTRLGELGYSPNKNGLRAYHMEHGGFADSTGQSLVTRFFGDNPVQSAEWLQQRGVPGLRYFDEQSRAVGKGTRNYVVFPGNEGLLSILGRE